jgi:hypothetical protein
VSTGALNLSWQREREWLGYAGLLPFLTGAAAVLIVSEAATAWLAADAMRYYAAVIASFLGAVHWGIETDSESRSARLRWGVLPALLAWSLLLAPVKPALALFGVLFVVILLVDRSYLPLLDERYRRLRVLLTAIVVGSLWLTAIALPEVPA